MIIPTPLTGRVDEAVNEHRRGASAYIDEHQRQSLQNDRRTGGAIVGLQSGKRNDRNACKHGANAEQFKDGQALGGMMRLQFSGGLIHEKTPMWLRQESLSAICLNEK
jgi:hypothetical protein